MAGTVMRLFGKKTVDFSGLGASGSQMLILHPGVNVAQYTKAQLLVRIHGAQSIANDNATIKVFALQAAPTEEDPALMFYSTQPILAMVTIDKNTQQEPGSGTTLLTASLPCNFGSHLCVVIMAEQSNPAGDCKATISVDLVLKG